jgi:flavin reductase (DIM6/NTAB) family NADH-FMN oxidoreductase RutF
MEKSIGARTFVLPTPVWVVGTYDEEGKPNVMNAAWEKYYRKRGVL